MKNKSLPAPILLALLGGAALGAVAIALTTPKTGKEVRDRLLSLATRFRSRANVQDDEWPEAMFI